MFDGRVSSAGVIWEAEDFLCGWEELSSWQNAFIIFDPRGFASEPDAILKPA